MDETTSQVHVGRSQVPYLSDDYVVTTQQVKNIVKLVYSTSVLRKMATAVKKKAKRKLPKHLQPDDARLEVCKEWKRRNGRFPKRNKKDKVENSLYEWLRNYRLGGKGWTQARWQKLNDAFGEGWEKECFPHRETGFFQPGHQMNRDETQWDAILDAVVEFWVIHGRFPKWSDGKLYVWLNNNLDATSVLYTQERANKLAKALNPLSFTGDWRMDTFTTRFGPDIKALAAAAVLARQHPESSWRGEAIPNRLAIADNLMARQNFLRIIQQGY